MPTGNNHKIRIRRFEMLEDRNMMSANVVCQPFPMSLTVDPRGSGYVATADHADSIANAPAAISDHGNRVSAVARQNPVQGIANPPPNAVSRATGSEPSSMPTLPGSLVPPSDGLGSICAEAWNGVKRIVSHGYDQLKAVPLIGSPLRKIDEVREAVRFAGISKIDIAGLRPGDVILCSSIGLVEAGIQGVTASRFNHAALYVGNGMVIDATNCYGIQQRPLADVIRGRFQVFVMRDDSLTDADRAAIVRHAERFIGGTYSTASALGGGTIKHIPGKDTYAPAKMCSELVWDVYFNALGGKRLTAINLPAPADLALSGTLSVAGRLV